MKNITTKKLIGSTRKIVFIFLIYVFFDGLFKLDTPTRIFDAANCISPKINGSAENITLPKEFRWSHEYTQVPEYTNIAGGKAYVQANVYRSSSDDLGINNKYIDDLRSHLIKNCWTLVRQINDSDWRLFAYDKNNDFVQFSWNLNRNPKDQGEKYLLRIDSTLDLK